MSEILAEAWRRRVAVVMSQHFPTWLVWSPVLLPCIRRHVCCLSMP